MAIYNIKLRSDTNEKSLQWTLQYITTNILLNNLHYYYLYITHTHARTHARTHSHTHTHTHTHTPYVLIKITTKLLYLNFGLCFFALTIAPCLR